MPKKNHQIRNIYFITITHSFWISNESIFCAFFWQHFVGIKMAFWVDSMRSTVCSHACRLISWKKRFRSNSAKRFPWSQAQQLNFLLGIIPSHIFLNYRRFVVIVYPFNISWLNFRYIIPVDNRCANRLHAKPHSSSPKVTWIICISSFIGNLATARIRNPCISITESYYWVQSTINQQHFCKSFKKTSFLECSKKLLNLSKASSA